MDSEFEDKDRKRGERRDLNFWYGRRAQKIHIPAAHPDGALDCQCEQSPLFFRKAKSMGCGGTKRQHGQPKVGRDACYAGSGWREAVKERIGGKRLCRKWCGLVVGAHPDDIEL